MAMSVGGERRGSVAEMNVVPLIDILLVLLVIFMIIPHTQVGLKVIAPQESSSTPVPAPEVVVVQVLADGALRINQQPVEWEGLQDRLEDVFKVRADRTAFIRGEDLLEFGVVAQAISIMHAAGITRVGLMTPGLQKGR
ncbi:MAG TPA: biopolymer transporter ExbD [Candidatus Saccharimonadales bacterium]|nr:biopolymer transporter ExbD [Candidatus Saccharimonadales bacterium]